MHAVEVVPDRLQKLSVEPRNAILRHDEQLGAVLAYVHASEAQKAKDRETVLLTALVIETVKSQHLRRPREVSARSLPGTGLAATLDCIKAHESGDYAEHSHPGSGSGAFQYVPGTWRHWSAAAGYPGYAYAYQAPPGVQDAVTEFTLTHGGAGNWSTRYGPDPCTGN